MEELLEKYGGGRIPPLVSPAGQPVEKGLLNGSLVAIYQRGFSGTYSIPLGILAADEVWQPVEQKWATANYSLNAYARRDWSPLCQTIRSVDAGDRACEACDRKSANKAERAGDVIAYLCCHGMIDFAVPVFVDGTAIAVLLTGQRMPRPGTAWNPEFVTNEGLFRPLNEGEEGVEAGPESNRRIAEAEQALGFGHGQLTSAVSPALRQATHADVSPLELETIIESLRKAGMHLSQLATATFQLEKARVVAWIRARIAESLKALTRQVPAFEDFWPSISSALALTNKYFGFDYGVIISCRRAPVPHFELLVSARENPDFTKAVAGLEVTGQEFDHLLDVVSSTREAASVDPELLARALAAATGRPLRKMNLKNAIAVSAGRSQRSLAFIALGHRGGDSWISRFTDVDRAALDDILAALSMVTNVVRLVGELEFAAQKQASFILDVSHDIRNPIQNIVVKAERLRSGGLTPDELSHHARRIGTQVKRLHLLSERIWTLEEIEQGRFAIDPQARCQVFDLLKACADSLLESAASRSVTLSIDPGLQKWPPLWIDPRFLTQTLLNLLDNAIKYSRTGTEVRVDGKDEARERRLSVVNRGVGILAEERELIFQKFYRTPAAQAWVLEGTGIGLSIVKKFAETYGRGQIMVRSQRIVGSRDSVTEFIVILDKEITEHV